MAKKLKRKKRTRKLKFRLTVPQLAMAIEMLPDKQKHELLDRLPEFERTMRFRWLNEVSKRKKRALKRKAKRSSSKAKTKKKKNTRKGKKK